MQASNWVAEWHDRNHGSWIDGVQALYLAMQRIEAKTLVWTKPGDGYGFPIAKHGYGDLIGEDRLSQV